MVEINKQWQATNSFTELLSHQSQWTQSKSWIRDKYFEPYLRIVIWAYGLERWKKDLSLLLKRIKLMYISQSSRRNERFVYEYLKESYTVCYSILTRNEYVPKVRISRDSRGLPRVIPVKIREKMMTDRILFVGCLCLLGIHRVVKWFPETDYSTILQPFNGLSRVLPIAVLKRAKGQLCELAGSDLSMKLGKIRCLVIESAGPNGLKGLTGCVYDAWAFYAHPLKLFSLTIWMFIHGGYRPLISLYSILTFSFPVYLIFKMAGLRLSIGRLATVYSTAGKARVVAMTNYWIQISLFPLHQGIFRILKQLPTDGTFKQTAPLQALMNKGIHLNSFDLTAATDRLPIELQVQVLSLYIGRFRAWLWSLLLSTPFWADGREIYYSVGQPMGAYSSWAMLALTHHHIVQASTPVLNKDYAVLGDDVIVSDSFDYLNIMKGLGVTISLAKSIQSSDWVEFAKRVYKTNGEDWSILGPGLIMSIVKNKYLYGMALATVYLQRFYHLSTAVSRLKAWKRMSSPSEFSFGLFILFGPNGLLEKNSFVATNVGMRELPRHLAQLGYVEDMLALPLRNMLVRQTRNSIKESRGALFGYIRFIWNDIQSRRSRVLRILYFVSLLLSPAIWVPLGKYLSGSLRDIVHADVFSMTVDELSAAVRSVRSDKLGGAPKRRFKDILHGYREFRRENLNFPVKPLKYREWILRNTTPETFRLKPR